MAPKPEKRIEFRASPELVKVAEKLAIGRRFIGLSGKPNLSQLMRVLIEEEAARQDKPGTSK